jgi:hypothetical protein
MSEQKTNKEFEEIEKEINENSISKEKIFEWFKEELERKDKIIKELRENNEILFNTAVRYNEREISTIPEEEKRSELNNTKLKKQDKSEEK